MSRKKDDSEKDLLLKYAIESYIETGEAISSKLLVEKYKLTMSSAKVRYILNELEQNQMLIKKHKSSGRIPSNQAYSYYINNLSVNNQTVLKNKMKDLFANRWNNIDNTLDESSNFINEIIDFALVTSQTNETDLLKSISLVPLSEIDATIILVDSNGKVYSKILHLINKNVKMNDIRIAVRIFKERLIDTRIVDLKTSVWNLRDIFSQSIKNYEEVLQNFVENIFNFEIEQKNYVYGKNKLILSEDINRTNLVKILDIMEKKSIWQTIEAENKDNDDSNIKILIDNNNTAIISKKLPYNSKIKEISAVGTKRMNYQKALVALQALEELIEEKTK
ncbi:heat-inducible transcriptional repressor HrcA [Mycoplasma sp. 1018B]|uniref:heat-inducible transcriptional repressor HrcA n=1 Tax=Mycoplasma sp. 1018B TaxID=2967302 RepID=UPI00211BF9EB|nr:heat-inducible transcriptional repressor HrcA [Mycoplasma sp. 1018B]UUM19170.1 heat-inducible transcriptional repressor HrcA [Mycoplasma sp. 1018B]